jgi:dienelactone hydrolase
MRKLLTVFAAATLFAGPAMAGMVADKVAYSLGGKDFEGILVYDDSVKAKRPAVVMAPNWMGVTSAAITKAKLLAGRKYVLFIADMYGKSVRPKGFKQALAASGAVRKDIAGQRARINKALDVLLAEGGKRGVTDNARAAAIGFCFGGGNVLELARSGRSVAGVVTFHGSLGTPQPATKGGVKTKILVLHGADDPAAPKAQRDALEAEMRAAGADYQIVAFSGTVHSFTDPNAKRPGRSMYNPKVAKRSYAMMNNFFAEIF